MGCFGSTIRPVFIFVSRAQYQPILKFNEVGEAVALDRFPGRFAEELTKALATANLR